jgi:hypothetical protein
MRGWPFCFALTLLALAPAAPASAQQVTKLSGYALGAETCGSFPKLPIAMRPGYCAGLVASKEDGLIFPRNVVQVPDTRFFVVVDMGGWDPGRGRVLLLDPQAPQGKRLTVLLTKLDLPHGLGVGPDRRIYVGTGTGSFASIRWRRSLRPPSRRSCRTCPGGSRNSPTARCSPATHIRSSISSSIAPGGCS